MSQLFIVNAKSTGMKHTAYMGTMRCNPGNGGVYGTSFAVSVLRSASKELSGRGGCPMSKDCGINLRAGILKAQWP